MERRLNWSAFYCSVDLCRRPCDGPAKRGAASRVPGVCRGPFEPVGELALVVLAACDAVAANEEAEKTAAAAATQVPQCTRAH